MADQASGNNEVTSSSTQQTDAKHSSGDRRTLTRIDKGTYASAGDCGEMIAEARSTLSRGARLHPCRKQTRDAESGNTLDILGGSSLRGGLAPAASGARRSGSRSTTRTTLYRRHQPRDVQLTWSDGDADGGRGRAPNPPRAFTPAAQEERRPRAVRCRHPSAQTFLDRWRPPVERWSMRAPRQLRSSRRDARTSSGFEQRHRGRTDLLGRAARGVRRRATSCPRDGSSSAGARQQPRRPPRPSDSPSRVSPICSPPPASPASTKPHPSASTGRSRFSDAPRLANRCAGAARSWHAERSTRSAVARAVQNAARTSCRSGSAGESRAERRGSWTASAFRRASVVLEPLVRLRRTRGSRHRIHGRRVTRVPRLTQRHR